MGGRIVRVKRGPDPEWLPHAVEAKKRGLTSLTQVTAYAPDIHISEWDWCTSKMDHTIVNDGSLQQLRNYTGLIIDLINLHSMPL
jgi:hypothetical protein